MSSADVELLPDIARDVLVRRCALTSWHDTFPTRSSPTTVVRAAFGLWSARSVTPPDRTRGQAGLFTAVYHNGWSAPQARVRRKGLGHVVAGSVHVVVVSAGSIIVLED